MTRSDRFPASEITRSIPLNMCSLYSLGWNCKASFQSCPCAKNRTVLNLFACAWSSKRWRSRRGVEGKFHALKPESRNSAHVPLSTNLLPATVINSLLGVPPEKLFQKKISRINEPKLNKRRTGTLRSEFIGEDQGANGGDQGANGGDQGPYATESLTTLMYFYRLLMTTVILSCAHAFHPAPKKKIK